MSALNAICSIQKLLKTERSLNGKALKKAVGNSKSAGGGQEHGNRGKQACSLPAPPGVCLQRPFPFSRGGGNAESDLGK